MTKAPYLIGIYSSMYGAGKTTFAKLLVDELGPIAETDSFSAPLKEIAQHIATKQFRVTDFCAENKKLLLSYPDGWPVTQNNGEPLDLRRLYQTIGTEWGRECIHQDVWVRLALGRALASRRKYIIYDDMRFANEYDAIKTQHGMTIRVHKQTEEVSAHASEGALNCHGFDEIVENNGSFAEFKENAKKIAEKIKMRAVVADACEHVRATAS